jgi:sodium-coupled neutral amino acid transporter 10
MIGFLLGTLVAFLVVMGDLGPEIVASLFNIDNNSSLRSVVMSGEGLGVAYFYVWNWGLLINCQ